LASTDIGIFFTSVAVLLHFYAAPAPGQKYLCGYGSVFDLTLTPANILKAKKN
jgi:hypothetical protein